VASRRRKKKKSSTLFKKVLWIFLVIGLLAVVLGVLGFQKIYAPNVQKGVGKKYVYIPSNSTYPQVLDTLHASGLIQNMDNLQWVLEKKQYPELVKPGRYLLEEGMSNNAIANRLRSGDQEPIKLTIKSNVQSLESLAGVLAANLEPDSLAMLAYINTPGVQEKYGLNANSIFSLFLPNTYFVFWNTSPEELIDRLAEEYRTFWTDARKAKALSIGLSQTDVSALAAIVTKETYRPSEEARIAGVYMNRVKKGIPLQADPTLIFALKDFTIKRVLNVHKNVESPFNTYKYKGLPPGPICIPRLSTLDAVLNYERHGYYYFCAREDFAGYHNFASSYTAHLVNARKYQRALNNRRIYK